MLLILKGFRQVLLRTNRFHLARNGSKKLQTIENTICAVIFFNIQVTRIGFLKKFVHFFARKKIIGQYTFRIGIVYTATLAICNTFFSQA